MIDNSCYSLLSHSSLSSITNAMSAMNFLSSITGRRGGKGKAPIRVNPLLAVCKDTQKKFGPILRVDNRVLLGIKNTTHYHWTYPLLRDSETFNTSLEFYNMDTIDCARSLQLRGLNVAALNMANPDTPTNWEGGCMAQEEALMYRSTYALSLDSDYKVDKSRRWSYPLKEIGGVYSPDNLVFKNNKWEMLNREDFFYMNFVAIAAIQNPETNKKRFVHDYDIQTTKEKMRAFFRICNMNGIDCPVAGALGCGVFGNPPEHIGLLWREVINEPEFRYMFKVIAFSILDGKTTQNFKVLQERIKFDDNTDDETDWEDFDEESEKSATEDEWRDYIENFNTYGEPGFESPVHPVAPSTTPEESPLPPSFRFQPSSSSGGTSFSVPPNAFPSFSTFPPFTNENKSADE